MVGERTAADDVPTYVARDFVETRDGLLFAVVAPGTEDDRVLGFLRYMRAGSALRKLSTTDANQLLATRYADYLYHSRERDVAVHGVPVASVVRHYRPATRLAEILKKPVADALEEQVRQVAVIVGAGTDPPLWLGVTGSLLVEAHRAGSDIDLVCYGRDQFAAARQRMRDAVADHRLSALSDTMWREAYARRGCSLSFAEYLWHERRKHNKFACGDTKVDISGIVIEPIRVPSPRRKLSRAVIRAVILDDTFAFDYPARYLVQHAAVQEIVCFTPTYTGQAFKGETVEAAGWIEQADDGVQRLAVDTSREGAGEYVKVAGQAG